MGACQLPRLHAISKLSLLNNKNERLAKTMFGSDVVGGIMRGSYVKLHLLPTGNGNHCSIHSIRDDGIYVGFFYCTLGKWDDDAM